jgi:hypothetical protein
MNYKKDSCFMKESSRQKSIFNYVVDQSRFVNNNECNNYTPPFLTYIPSGIPKMNVDLENELKGMNNPIAKCTECKYNPENNTLVQVNPINFKPQNFYPNNKKECLNEYNILPNGYLRKK